MSAVIEKAYDRAKDILATNREKLEALAQSLLKNEVIFKEDVERILGARPFASAAPTLAVPAQDDAAVGDVSEAPASPETSSPSEEGAGEPKAEE